MSSEVKQPTFFLGCGEGISKSEFMDRIAKSKARVLYIGENHEDSSAHLLELEILQAVKTTSTAEQNTALSLEFYDREAQTVLNEYLAGQVNLDTFLCDSRPPANHQDYQPLIDFCRVEGWRVIAANCPRRYTRMVGKQGRDYLMKLEQTSAVNLLPPLPYSGASEAYKNNFISIMHQMGNNNPNVPTTILDAQSLWDATMAHSIVQGLTVSDRIVHVTGYFHVQHKLGTVEHLERYLPGTEALTVVILPSEDLDALNDEQKDIGDLVALTDINQL